MARLLTQPMAGTAVGMVPEGRPSASAQIAFAVEEPPIAPVEFGRLHARLEAWADLAHVPHQDPLQLRVLEVTPNASPAALDGVVFHAERYPVGGTTPMREHSAAEFVPLPHFSWSERPLSLPLDVDEIATALFLSHGDLSRAAALLKVDKARLMRPIRRSPRLQRLVDWERKTRG
jgi:hypothetical protein